MSGNLSVDSFLHAVAGDLVGGKNPLEVACEHSSVRVAEEILSRRPELAKMKNGDGKVPMHIASEKGDERMVELLAKVSPEACLVEGFASMIPLHLAVIHGHSEVIKAIISTCPQSVLKKTSNQDTVLHLPLKNSQLCTFYLLLSEVKKLNHLHELLNARDGEGNTILHIATSKKLIKLLLVEGMEVCTQNYKGITVLDLCYENSEDGAYKKIRKILTDSKRKVFLGGFSLLSLSNSEVLAFAELITVACFTVLCNMPEPILKDVNLPSEVVPVMDFISGKLSSLFYILPLISTPFMTCTFLVGTFRWPTSDVARLLRFVWVCKCGVFILLVNKLTPKFSTHTHSLLSALLKLISTVAASQDSNLLSISHRRLSLQSPRSTRDSSHSLSSIGQSSLKLISTVAASPNSNLLSQTQTQTQTHTHLLSSVGQSWVLVAQVLFLCVGECGLLNIVVVRSVGDFAKELALFGMICREMESVKCKRKEKSLRAMTMNE
ncbi:hypothetical protein Patl1_30032 [Pistacia atlantica]|uniref:Uncharacterized protein n=1 Tax=Pistacia atlantica TaxID=434234 RepID=A0ACC1ACH1_9ROSI|nr:hypothetical protein Patl1_30032 [Pistacia atlantica]